MQQGLTTRRPRRTNPDLQLVTTVPDLDGQPPLGWEIYRVADSPLVSPLAYRPVSGTTAPSLMVDGGAQAPPASGSPAVSQITAMTTATVRILRTSTIFAPTAVSVPFDRMRESPPGKGGTHSGIRVMTRHAQEGVRGIIAGSGRRSRR